MRREVSQGEGGGGLGRGGREAVCVGWGGVSSVSRQAGAILGLMGTTLPPSTWALFFLGEKRGHHVVAVTH